MLNIKNEVTFLAILGHVNMIRQWVGLYIRVLVCEGQDFISH